MNVASRFAAVLLAMVVPVSASAQSDKPGQKANAEVPKVPPVPAAVEELRKVLRDGVEAIGRVEDELNRPDPRGTRRYESISLGSDLAVALQTIGTAQAKLGDRKSARETWRRAIEAANKLNDPWETIDILIAIADARMRQGEPEAAIVTLRFAESSIQRPDQEPKLDLMSSIDVMGDSNTGDQRAQALRLIGLARRRAGAHEAARLTFRQAVGEAGTLAPKKIRTKLYSWAMVAVAQDPADAEETWTKAIRAALAITGEFDRARGVEIVVRARTKAGQHSQVLRTIDTELKGDLVPFAIWMVADELADGKSATAPAIVDPLLDRVNKAGLVDEAKKAKILMALARIRAASGDRVGMEKLLQAIRPPGASGPLLLARIKLNLAGDLAEAQLKAGDRASARETLRAASVPIRPDPDEFHDGPRTAWYLQRIAELQAKAGDVPGAIRTAETLLKSSDRAEAFTKITGVQAESGGREAALETLKRANLELAGIDNQDLWERHYFHAGIDRPDNVKEYQLRRMVDDSHNDRLISDRERILKEMAEVHAKAKDIDGAYRTVESIPKGSQIFDIQTALRDVGKIQAKSGDFEGALRTADRIKAEREMFDHHKKELIEAIAKAQARAGDAEGAMKWLVQQKDPTLRLAALKGLGEGIALKD